MAQEVNEVHSKHPKVHFTHIADALVGVTNMKPLLQAVHCVEHVLQLGPHLTHVSFTKLKEFLHDVQTD